MEEAFYTEKVIAQDEYDDGYITEAQYNARIAEIEAREDEYYNAEWY